LKIRLAKNSDQKAIIELIDSVLGEYDDSVCLDSAEADLLDIESNYFAKTDQNGKQLAGAFWVLENEPGKIIGTHAAIELTKNLGTNQDDSKCTFRRLYLNKDLRGTQWGQRLMQNNIDWAKEQGISRIEFWSDTRFERAHRFFEKFGFQKSGEVRSMDDSHEVYQEFFFFLDLH